MSRNLDVDAIKCLFDDGDTGLVDYVMTHWISISFAWSFLPSVIYLRSNAGRKIESFKIHVEYHSIKGSLWKVSAQSVLKQFVH